MSKGRPPLPDKHYQLVGQIAERDIEHALPAVMAHFGVKRGTAYKYLHGARDRGCTTWTPRERLTGDVDHRKARYAPELFEQVLAFAEGRTLHRLRHDVAAEFGLSYDEAKYVLKTARQRFAALGPLSDDSPCPRCRCLRREHRALAINPANAFQMGVCIRVLRRRLDRYEDSNG